MCLRSTDLHHFAQFVQVASAQVQESELIEAFRALVAHLDHLVVTLAESHSAQSVPAGLRVENAGRLQRELQYEYIIGHVQ